MAHIEQFTVHGLAARKGKVHRKLDRHVNIFWGLNGTGKTSLLKILSAALRNDSSALERIPFERATVTFWSRDHNARLRRTYINEPEVDQVGEELAFSEEGFTLEPLGDGFWKEVPEAPSKGWKTEVLQGEIGANRRPDMPFRHAYLPISRMSEVNRHARSGPRPQIINDAFLDEHFAEQVRQRWQIYNSEALSQIRGIQQQGLASILAHLFGGGTGTDSVNPEKVPGDEAYRLVSSFMREQRLHLRLGREEFLRRYEGESDLRTVVANIQEVMRDVGEVLRPQQEFQDTIRRLYSGGKELVLDYGSSIRGTIGVTARGKKIPLESLSAGEKQLLRLMLETLAAEDSVVMIDEPELSMHVDWQQVLVAAMRRVNPDCQLLLATHSPEVMADVSGDYVFEL